MKPYLLFIALVIAGQSLAQDTSLKRLDTDARLDVIKDSTDTLGKKWILGGLFNLNVVQGSLTNWAAGGDDFSLAITSSMSLYGFYKEGRHSWDNTLDLAYGNVTTTTLGSRKNDDRIDMLSKYGYAIGPKWNLAALFNFRSQMFPGYTYPNEVEVYSSAFLSPAYVTLSVGFDYQPSDNFSVFLSPLTARWIIVKDDSLAAQGLYGVDPGNNHEVEIGALLSAQYLKAFNKILTYKARLDLFSNYKHNPQNLDLFMTNILSAKLTNSISANWNIDFIYDDDVRLFGENGNVPALQIKSIVGIGVLVKF